MPLLSARRLLFGMITLVGVALVIEGLGHGAYRYLYGHGYSPDDVGLDAAPIESDADVSPGANKPEPKEIRGNILHPYVGFTGKGTAEDHGFPSLVDVVARPAEGQRVVAMVGGSVANAVAPLLEAALRGGSNVPDQLIFVDLTKRGFKQPQQLLLVSYLLSIGAHYDVVINLDGYNEAVLPFIENYRTKTFPFFPRRWDAQIDRAPTAEALAGIGKITYLRERERALRAGFDASGLTWSALAGLLVRLRVEAVSNEVSFEEHRVQNLPREGFEGHGPFRRYATGEDLQDEMLEVWFRSSRLLAGLVREEGGVYYHFLQPNQYLEGSKPLNDTERRRAMMSGAHRELIEALYPRMRTRGPELDGVGAKFVDATQVFAEREETLYIDTCCHVNASGNTLIAAFIARTLESGPLASQ